MNNQKEIPQKVQDFYKEYTEKWHAPQFASQWMTKLKYVEDAFHDGWLIDIFRPDSEKYPEIYNVPADGSVPCYMVAKCVYSYIRGVEDGMSKGAEIVVAKLLAKTASDTIALVRSNPNAIQLPSEVKITFSKLKEA